MTHAIVTQLADWKAKVRNHQDHNPTTADNAATDRLIAEADRRELEAIKARQAANRGLIYTRRRPTRYAHASYNQLRADQNPRDMVSTWRTRGPRALVLAGPARTGKTTAAYAITNDAHNHGTWAMAWTAAALSAALKPDSGDPHTYEYATTCELLLLDDLGRERVTDWWLEQLQRIVDERCANERRLIVTTNAAADAEQAYSTLVERYGDPLVERLIDGGGVVILDGPPVRDLVTEW